MKINDVACDNDLSIITRCSPNILGVKGVVSWAIRVKFLLKDDKRIMY
jgi:hypothetical protein